MFVNNPLCGIVILAGLFTAGPNIGCGTLLGGSVATLTEMVSFDWLSFLYNYL